MAIRLKPKEDLFENVGAQKQNEIITFLYFALAFFIFISLFTYDDNDIQGFTSDPVHIKNFFGIIGAYFACASRMVMGLSSYSIPILIAFWAMARLAGAKIENYYFKFFGMVFLILAISSGLSLLPGLDSYWKFRLGGMIGISFSGFLVKYLNVVGAFLTIFLLLGLSLLITTDFLIFPFFVGIFSNATDKINQAKTMIKAPLQKKEEPVLLKRAAPSVKPVIKSGGQIIRPVNPLIKAKEKVSEKIKEAVRPLEPKPAAKAEAKPFRTQPEIMPAAESVKQAADENAPVKVNAGTETKQGIEPEPISAPKPYTLPGLELLKSPPPVEEREIEDDLNENSRILEEILRDFDIEAKVIEVNKGPVITRYEMEPGPGVKVHRITSLADNIALGMKAQSVRIVAPVPGKGTIGVEVPNSKGVMVFLKEILESDDYKEDDSKLKLALGKDIAGEPVIADLAGMPHLLIAGATGSGKTVCVNSIITSMLFNATPEEIKFIMVDPKKVELAPFNNLPHLLCPVVTDYKKVPIALDWLVREMERRYELFAKCAVRNIDYYNKKAAEEKWQPLFYIVIIIDELADLMMASPQEVEGAIMRLAQLSRAVGIHMILATQRPSVDVITGVIKANFPSRISFKVASKVDSRTVLDINGADKLLGKGDMLFIEPGSDKPVRAQGSLVFDEEIERLTQFIKDQRPPEYVEEIMEVQKRAAGQGGRFQRDEIYEEAVRVVLDNQQASVSIVQRKLGVGYTKAARLIDMMEEDGIVGPYQGSKPRDILIDPTAETKGGGNDGAADEQ